MKNTRLTVVAFAAVSAITMLTPQATFADSRQKNKNLWRNLAIGAGVIGAHGLITHNGTETLLGLGGAAYSANRYEQDRRSQSRASHRSYYYRNGHRYYYRSNGTLNNGARAFHNGSGYGPGMYGNSYSNIKYFTKNGHVYYKNLDTGQVYLSQW